jgi:hypothetical protein
MEEKTIRVLVVDDERPIRRFLHATRSGPQAGEESTHLMWGSNSETKAHLLRVNASNLRQKIEADPVRPHYIVTEPGVGYRLRAD